MSSLPELYSKQFMPHGHCYFWDPRILWLHVGSDSLIALSYYSIPLSLLYMVGRRKDIPYSWMLVFFALFILGCGTTHVFEVLTVWHPFYLTSGIIKLGTAIISVVTAISLIKIIPATLSLPTASLLANLNSELRQRVDAHRDTESKLRATQASLENLLMQLEARVQDRTKELEQVNTALQLEVITRAKAEGQVRALNSELVRKVKILETLYDVVPIGLGVAEDRECRTISANTTLKQLLGVSSDGYPISPFNDGHKEHTEGFRILNAGHVLQLEDLPMQRAAREGIVIRDFEEEIVQHNGEIRSLLAYAAPIKDSENKINGCVGVFIDITERKKMEEMLRRSVAQQEALLREVHHRVKNNLQVISSMFDLQLNYLRDAHAKEVFRESQERVRSMALIHEGFYKSGKFGKINLRDYVGALVTSLRHTMGKAAQVRITLDIPSVELSLDGAVPLGLILNELLSNSFKHAFVGTRTGTIKICGKVVESTLELSLEDNGVGSADAVEISKAKSFGLRIIWTLVRQLDGKIEVQSNAGVKTTLLIPLARLRQNMIFENDPIAQAAAVVAGSKMLNSGTKIKISELHSSGEAE